MVDATLEKMDLRDIAAMAATCQADEYAAARARATELQKLLEALDDEIPGIIDAWESCEDGAVVAIRVLEWATDDAHRENEALEAELCRARAELAKLKAAK